MSKIVQLNNRLRRIKHNLPHKRDTTESPLASLSDEDLDFVSNFMDKLYVKYSPTQIKNLDLTQEINKLFTLEEYNRFVAIQKLMYPT
jgi:CII-binding regulator of phage lambda lysogenization HflD